MSEQITWTHVDKLVRQMLDDRMQMPCGKTDAEVAYDFIKFLGRQVNSLDGDLETKVANLLRLRAQLETTQQQLARTTKPGKTKTRLAKLEEQMADLQQRLERNCL